MSWVYRYRVLFVMDLDVADVFRSFPEPTILAFASCQKPNLLLPLKTFHLFAVNLISLEVLFSHPDLLELDNPHIEVCTGSELSIADCSAMKICEI
jgi:hypothetical protein